MDDKSRMKFPISRTCDPSKLLARITAELHADDLLDIARCDYGDGVELHLEQLQYIARNLSVPVPFGWYPAEVLQLMRWIETAQDATNDGLIQMHRQRAFCCTVLMTAMCDPESSHDGSNCTLIQLIESLRELQLSTEVEAADLLVCLLDTDPDDHDVDTIFFGLGLLHFALAVPQWDNAALVELIDWIMVSETAAPSIQLQYANLGANDTWLLSKTIYDHRHMKWRQLGSELSGRLSNRHNAQVVERVELIAALLSQKS